MFEPSAIFNLFFPPGTSDREARCSRQAMLAACTLLLFGGASAKAGMQRSGGHAADVLVVSTVRPQRVRDAEERQVPRGCDAVIGCLLHSRCREVLVVSVVVFG